LARKKAEDSGEDGIMGSRREALALYRDCLRAARRFHWANDKGEPWSDVLKKSARKEFEEARTERVRTDQPLQQEMSWA